MFCRPGALAGASNAADDRLRITGTRASPGQIPPVRAMVSCPYARETRIRFSQGYAINSTVRVRILTRTEVAWSTRTVSHATGHGGTGLTGQVNLALAATDLAAASVHTQARTPTARCCAKTLAP